MKKLSIVLAVLSSAFCSATDWDSIFPPIHRPIFEAYDKNVGIKRHLPYEMYRLFAIANLIEEENNITRKEMLRVTFSVEAKIIEDYYKKTIQNLNEVMQKCEQQKSTDKYYELACYKFKDLNEKENAFCNQMLELIDLLKSIYAPL